MTIQNVLLGLVILALFGGIVYFVIQRRGVSPATEEEKKEIREKLEKIKKEKGG
jgi:preprotein translocase subunit YajC